MVKTIYQYEVGVLLDKNNKEYEAYSDVWDKKHGYYNEDWGIELKLDNAKDYVKGYVKDGINNTYGIISEIEINDDEMEDIKENFEDNGYFDATDFDFDYNLSSIIYSTCKLKDKIIENFVKKEAKNNAV